MHFSLSLSCVSLLLHFRHDSTAACVTLTEGSVVYSRNHPPKHSGPVVVFNVGSELITLWHCTDCIGESCLSLVETRQSQIFHSANRAAHTSLSHLCAICACACIPVLSFILWIVWVTLKVEIHACTNIHAHRATLSSDVKPILGQQGGLLSKDHHSIHAEASASLKCPLVRCLISSSSRGKDLEEIL